MNKNKDTSKNIINLNELSLLECINLMPKDVQTKLCIYTWREFWRDYVPQTAKIPSWFKRKNYIEKTLWEAKQKNIHFLHLPFNTLPENKKWIMGCQCDTCISDQEICIVEKHMHYLIQSRNPYYFSENFIVKETFSNWNEYLVPIGNNYDSDNIEFNKIFDPLCGSYKENYTSKRLREGGTFEFSYPV